MSFAEFGASSSAKKRPQQRPQSSPYSGNGGLPASSQLGGLDSISESLLQYQRNVDILSKIVRSLNTSNIHNPNTKELSLQYQAQVDVLGLLQQKVENQLQQQLQQTDGGGSTNPQRATIITKLKRDFERVQLQAKSLQEAARPKMKAILSAGTDTSSNKYANNTQNFSSTEEQSAEAILAQQQRQMQAQIQADRLAEEIMREREEEIRNINRGMHQVNEIYKDLAHIVGEQQEQIDTIETQMDDARANAESGLQQVEKANEKFGNQCSVM